MSEPIKMTGKEGWYYGAFEIKVEKANKKAQKAGLGAPFRLSEPTYYTVTKIDPVLGYETPETRVDFEYSIEGPTGKEGWEFVASVDWALGAPVVNVAPTWSGGLIPRPTEPWCDHCQAVRSRHETFLVQGPDGEVKQVGRQCLTAYTGIPLGWPSTTLGFAGDPDEAAIGGSRAKWSEPLDYVLTWAIALTDSVGYVSKSAATETQRSTRELFWLMTSSPRHDSRADAALRASTAQALEQRTKSDKAMVAEIAQVKEWALTGKGAQSSDYRLNLQAIVQAGVVPEKMLGYALSIPVAARRDAERAAKQQAEQAQKRAAAGKPAAKPVPSGRITVVGEVKTIKQQESIYGIQWKMRVVTEEGWAVWGTIPSSILGSTEIGSVVQFTAKVEPSRDDPTFGFFSRPTKASVVRAASAA